MNEEKIQIKNRFTNKVIVEIEAENIREVVEKNKANLREANLQEANLQEADLQGANLREANLREANLWGADLRKVKIKITQEEEFLKSIGVQIERN